MKNKNTNNKGGRPPHATSLTEVTMSDLLAVCNAQAKVTVGRIWAENQGILEKDSYKSANRFNSESLF